MQPDEDEPLRRSCPAGGRRAVARRHSPATSPIRPLIFFDIQNGSWLLMDRPLRSLVAAPAALRRARLTGGTGELVP
jgi:hypothetical protein